MRHDPSGERGEARRQLNERLQRESMGDAAYDRMVSGFDARPFKIFGAIFLIVFGLIVLAISWLGY